MCHTHTHTQKDIFASCSHSCSSPAMGELISAPSRNKNPCSRHSHRTHGARTQYRAGREGFSHFFFLNKDILGAQSFSAPAVSPGCFNQCWGCSHPAQVPAPGCGCSGLVFSPQHHPSQCFRRQIMGFFFFVLERIAHMENSLFPLLRMGAFEPISTNTAQGSALGLNQPHCSQSGQRCPLLSQGHGWHQPHDQHGAGSITQHGKPWGCCGCGDTRGLCSPET